MAGYELPLPDLAVAQPLRLLAALTDNMGSVPSTHGGSHSSITSVPGDLVFSSRALGAHGVLTYMQA